MFENQNNIDYVYNAIGQKVKKSVKTGQEYADTDYLSGFQYRGSYTNAQGDQSEATLQYFPHAEGYIQHVDGRYFYIYHYTDHLGNIRLSYTYDENAGMIKIMEENHYYPFGLKHDNYNTQHLGYTTYTDEDEITTYVLEEVPRFVGDGSYNYKYQGQERQDELGLNWDSFKWRNYDYAIGRFMSIDPLAEKYNYQSPYNFAENRVVDGNELEGLEWVDADNNLVYDPSARNGRGDYTANATAQDKNYGNALKSTPTGSAQFNKLTKMTHPVLIEHNTTDTPTKDGVIIFGASITPKENNPEGKTTITVFEKNIDGLVDAVNNLGEGEDALWPLNDGTGISIKGITKVDMLGVTLGEEVEHATDENINLQHKDTPSRAEVEKIPNQISDKILKESINNN